jgi:hypothetical protein
MTRWKHKRVRGLPGPSMRDRLRLWWGQLGIVVRWRLRHPRPRRSASCDSIAGHVLALRGVWHVTIAEDCALGRFTLVAIGGDPIEVRRAVDWSRPAGVEGDVHVAPARWRDRLRWLWTAYAHVDLDEIRHRLARAVQVPYSILWGIDP